jgi:hypothetical protein
MPKCCSLQGEKKMKTFYLLCALLLSSLFLSACAGGGLFCDPRYEHCGDATPQMKDEIADEVGQML